MDYGSRYNAYRFQEAVAKEKRDVLAQMYASASCAQSDTDESARELLEATRHPAVRTLWQPPVDWPVQKCCESLRGVLPRLQHVHAYHWPRAGERGELAGGEAEWGEYLRVLADAGRA